MHVIFTDLDSTLLHHETYRFDAARPLLSELDRSGIPVIPVTSKTRKEVEHHIQSIGPKTPFIVENGSGIFVPNNYFSEEFKFTQFDETYSLINLGCSYPEARKILRLIEKDLNCNLSGFGDLTDNELQRLTKLDEDSYGRINPDLPGVKRAKVREFTEPFVKPSKISLETLQETANHYGFRILQGGRFFHLLPIHASKGNAVNYLVNLYHKKFPNRTITTIGLGDSPNDLAMLEVVDIPIVIPGASGTPNSELENRGWYIAKSPAPEGWVEGVSNFINLKTLSPV